MKKVFGKRLSYGLYRVIRWFVWLFYPKTKVEGLERLPDEGAVIVGNHTQMNGPICGELYFPGKRKIWCAWQMMKCREVPKYAFADFWSEKPKYIRWFYKCLSYVIAPFSACVFQNANTIPVYHDNRLISTFRQSISALEAGERVIIFPEGKEPYNQIVNQFQNKFVDTGRLYFKRTGKKLAFVPMYIAPALKTMYLGEPTYFDPEQPIDLERERICTYLMERITKIAEGLPEHKVVPYQNKPRREYVTNRTEVKTP